MSKSEKIKIAYIGHKRIPSNEGGVERVVMEHVSRLAEHGHKVYALNRCGKDYNSLEYDNQDRKYYHGCKIINIPTIYGCAEVPIYSFLATLWCIFKRPDIVIFNASGSCVMIPLARLFGLKTVGLLHGIDSQRGKWGHFASWYLKIGERMLATKANVGLVLSNNMKKIIDDKYGSNVGIFENGVDKQIKHSAEIITNKFGLNSNSYILSLGRIVPEKGLHYLIEAFKNVKTDKKLVIAGGADDNTQKYLTELKDLAKNDKRIFFIGFAEGQLKQELFTNTYLFCLPSDVEGMANTLLESMAYGNCILCSDIPENTEVVLDNAIVHKKADVLDLANKLQYLCDNPMIVKQYSDLAEGYICDKYNWDKVMDKMEDIFHNITA